MPPPSPPHPTAHPALAFAHKIWADQLVAGWCFLAYVDPTGAFRTLAPTLAPALPAHLPNEGNDVYFSPTLYRHPERRKAHARRSRWLYADLDAASPHALPAHLTPTIAWATSPNRYQALWRLNIALSPQPFQDLNRRLSYAADADANSWILTKVLRLPHTLSTKYAIPHRVTLLWDDGPSYSPRRLSDSLPPLPLNGAPTAYPIASFPATLPKPADALKSATLPTRARKLLRARHIAAGERSERLWELERLLLEAGLPLGHVYALVQASPLNKYRGSRRERSQLWAEINKAAATQR